MCVCVCVCVCVCKNKSLLLDLDRESDCVELLINEVFKSQVIPLFPQPQRESVGDLLFSQINETKVQGSGSLRHNIACSCLINVP